MIFNGSSRVFFMMPSSSDPTAAGDKGMTTGFDKSPATSTGTETMVPSIPLIIGI